MPSSGDLREQLLTKAEFWRSLWVADEPEACNMAAVQTFEVIDSMDLRPPHGATLLMVTSRYVNTGDRAELDALLTEIANQT